MKISLNWIKQYVPLNASVEDLKRAITFLGFEVEGVVQTGAPRLENVFVGEVLTRDKHPNADKLSVCTVDVGPAQGVRTIVCGAQNYKVGDRVPVALPGAVLPGDFVIKHSKIRGQPSEGMMCSGRELGIGEDHTGLLILANRPALGTPINDVLPPGDTVFDVEITPNRPDCLSHLGLARELAAWFKLPLAYPEIRFRGDVSSAGAPREDLLRAVRVDAPEDCPLYTAHVLVGVKIGPSPLWLRERLESVGLRSINNVVDVGNYVMLEYGQPLHAFDARRLGGQQIVVRRASDGEKIVTLDGKERALTQQMLVIADETRPVVVAGIMGGADSGVADDTTDLVLECAYFRRQSIRATSKRLGLSSDSSYRYERGVDPHTTLEAAWRAVDLIIEVAGGKVVGPVYQVGGTVPWSREIVLSPDFVRARVGFEIANDEMRAALESLELLITREENGSDGLRWTVTIPSWRDDLDRPIDLVEEILRLYGTERIPPAVVSSPGLVGDDDPVVLFNRRVTDYLVGQNFHECVNYTLRPAKETARWVSQTAAAELALANPFVEDQSHLRPSIIMGLLETLHLNQSRGVVVTHLAETGRVFIERNGQNWECAAVGFVIAEPIGRRTWIARGQEDFFTAKHHIEVLASLAGVELARQPLAPVDLSNQAWQPGHSAASGDLSQGWSARFGLISLAMTKSLGLEGRVYGGIFAILPEKVASETIRRRYQPFSLFPAALRDIALVVAVDTPADEVRRTVAKTARAAAANAFALEEINVFDVYQGDGLPAGMKSLAFSLVFRASDRTLTDDEVNRVFQALQKELTSTHGYTLRA